MVVFTHFDPTTLGECLKYVQDSLDWLADNHRNCQHVEPGMSKDALMQVANTLHSLSHSARSRYNDMTPVNRLPPEILSQVFLHIRGDFPQVSFSPSPPPRDDPSLYQYNLVCRHWHWVLTSNPSLWNCIYLSSGTLLGSARGVSLKLLRSQTTPLSVYIDKTVAAHHIVQQQGHQILLHARRIQDLRMFNPSSQVLKPILNRARELKVLEISNGGLDRHAEALPCTLPQLEVLSAFRTSIWQKWSTGNLRYLSLSSQTWRSDSIESFIQLLETNPHLEELMLDKITVRNSDWNRVNLAVEGRPPFSLLRLRRVLVRDMPASDRGCVSSPMSKIVSRLVVPHDNARQFLTYPAFTEVPSGFPARRLCLAADAIIGTDGTSAWAVSSYSGGHCGFLTHNIHPAEVEALWFTRMNTVYYSVPVSFLAMQNVTKLVFTASATFWIEGISRCFHHLQELQVHTQKNEDGRRIIGFLDSRKYHGNTIRTLRFVREPSIYDNMAFFPWKKGCWKFARHVGRVIFEERRNDGTDPDYFDFTLPDVCNTPSPVHAAWKPWRQSLM